MINKEYLDPQNVHDRMQREPFKHVVLDDFFHYAHIPDLIHIGKNTTTAGLDVAMPVSSQPNKFYSEDVSLVPSIASKYLHFLAAGPFTNLLGKWMGIDNLISDPTFEGGGIHLSKQGGHLEPHTDFTSSRALPGNLQRRLNILVYLSPHWEESWGGCLELYNSVVDTEGLRYRSGDAEVKIMPKFNRAIIFETSLESIHGFPEKIRGDHSRVSMALYYFQFQTKEFDKQPVLWYN